jgi:hypothetical protein
VRFFAIIVVTALVVLIPLCLAQTGSLRVRKLDPVEEETLFTTLAGIGFWNLPARVEYTDRYTVTVDGTEWAIEGVRDGECHAVSRYSSPLAGVFSQYFLADVGKVKPYYKNTH